MAEPGVTPFLDAPQHGPRPLPLFLDLLRKQTAGSPEARAAALAGLAAYQSAPRPSPRPPRPVVAQAARARLLDLGGDGPPVVLIPSLINPPFVLDLAPGNSLAEHLAGSGNRVLLVDWGTPTPADRAQTATAHVETMLLPLLDALGEPAALVGYCLGGTLALAAARSAAARGLALIAAPWHFAGYPADHRAAVAALWASAKEPCDTLGLVPMEVLQSGFWRLDPARTVAKFGRFASLDPASPAAQAFVALEDWANGGAPLTFAAGAELFEKFFAEDVTGAGEWWVAGSRVRPADLDCAAIEFVSTTDRITPAASAAGLADLRPLSSGHVGMLVGGRARAQLWEPLAFWLTTLGRPR